MRVLAIVLLTSLALGQPAVTSQISGNVISPLLEGVPAILEIEGRQVETRADGTFRAEGFTPGQTMIVVRSPGWKSQTVMVDLQEGQNRLPPIPITVASYCGRGEDHLSWIGSVNVGAVRGSVRLAPGDIVVTLEPEQKQTGPASSATFVRAGEFRFQDLAPGRYRLIARGPGFYEASWPIRIWAGLEANFESPFWVTLCPDRDCRVPQEKRPQSRE